MVINYIKLVKNTNSLLSVSTEIHIKQKFTLTATANQNHGFKIQKSLHK